METEESQLLEQIITKSLSEKSSLQHGTTVFAMVAGSKAFNLNVQSSDTVTRFCFKSSLNSY
jgi:hypothetical protein